MRTGHYNFETLVQALHDAGLQTGDVVYSHLAPLALGIPQEVASGMNFAHFVYSAFREVIGSSGSFLTPTYTYSFCKRQEYDRERTRSEVGAVGEWLRLQPGFVRSDDPMFSVCGCGPSIEYLFADLPHTCFGKNCIYERLERMKAKVCHVGLTLHFTSALYHVLWRENVPYRYDKLFTGHVVRDDKRTQETWVYNVRPMIPQSVSNFTPLHHLALDQGKAVEVNVGQGTVVCANLHDVFALCTDQVQREPWSLIFGSACDVEQEEKKRTGVEHFKILDSSNCSAKDIIEKLWNLPRDLVSDGYDASIEYLATVLPMTIHKYPTGKNAFTWIVPERWQCKSARITSDKGELIVDAKNNPLHCMRYSLPFKGRVSREELFLHLHTIPYKPDNIPYIFKFYAQNWGMCCSYSLKQSLSDDFYNVEIDTETSMSSAKVGEVVVPGRSSQCIILCAHLDHPYQVSDGLSGVAVGMEVFNRLRQHTDLHYTYRLLLVPETIGSAAWLSEHMHLVPQVQGGVFLEMLSHSGSLTLKHSARPECVFDRTVSHMMRGLYKVREKKCHEGPLNDERMFNAYGIDIPMLSIFRTESEDTLFVHYHDDKDNIESVDDAALAESVEAVYQAIMAAEKNSIPVPRYKGELFATVTGIDYGKYIFELIALTSYMDGKKSIMEICEQGETSFSKTLELCRIFEIQGFIDLHHI